MRKFALSNRHTNIIAVASTHRHDLPEYSCVNQETQIFNRKLRKMTKDIHHVSVVDTNLTRDDFTRHGLHLNSIGKEMIAKTIEQSIGTLSLTGIPAISLYWKEVPLATPTAETMMGPTGKNVNGEHNNPARSSCKPKRPPITRSKDFLWVTGSSKTV